MIFCRSRPTEGNFFAVVKSFDANTVISVNFILTVKNSNDVLFSVCTLLPPTNEVAGQ